jgi:uncharacterized protein
MTREKISIHLARSLAINPQFSFLKNSQLNPKELTVNIIEKLGYIQIDTLHVVQRAHHHTLWTRNKKYSPDILNELLSNERRVFEYWGHAASYLPMKDYRYYLPKMATFKNPEKKWTKDRLERYGHLLDPVLKRIRDEGALGTKDFEATGDKRKGIWWDWKPAKAALEILYWQGKLMVSRRDKFQKIYDLPERVLPDWVDKTMPSQEEAGRFFVKRALVSYGIASKKDIINHIQVIPRNVIEKSLQSMVDEQTVSIVTVDTIPKLEFYVLPDVLENSGSRHNNSRDVHILSPFDNMVILRDRIRKLFGFNYTIECYVPSAKRHYGYFVLPILYGKRFVGRMDSKADSKTKIFNINNLYFENSFRKSESFLNKFAKKIAAFALFNRCTIIYSNSKINQSVLQELIKRSNKYLN